MSKKKIFNEEKLGKLRQKLQNSLSAEAKDKVTQFKEGLDSLIDELEKAEVQYSEKEVMEQVKEFLSSFEEKVREEVAESIAKRFSELQDNLNRGNGKELPDSVKNAVCAAILRSKGREDVEDNVNEVLVKNGISGLSFGEVIDYAIIDAWENNDPLFKKFKKTPFTKFFYTKQEMNTAETLAKGWNKAKGVTKKEQTVTLSDREIKTQYIYKLQEIHREDLDRIEKDATVIMRWLQEELDQQIINSAIRAVLVGDSVNDEDDRVTSFESIGLKTDNDFFTSVKTAAGQTVTLQEVRETSDLVKNTNGVEKVAIMSAATLTAISEFKHSDSGSILYRSKDEIAAQIGVSNIYVTDIMKGAEAAVIIMLPDEYWVHEKATHAFVYPSYKNNRVGFLKERNMGGLIHGLYSTAVLRKG